MSNKRKNYQILIIGNGRWAEEIIKETLNIIKYANKLFIYGDNTRVDRIIKKFKINQIFSLRSIEKIFHIW